MKPLRRQFTSLFVAMLCGGPAWMLPAGTVTDSFNTGADFVANGVTNTIWDGVYLNSGDVPNGILDGGSGPAATTAANDTTNPGFLTVQDSSTYWNAQADDGFFLWKAVAGDFDVSVTVTYPYQNGAYHMAGLLARAFTTNGPAWGAPFSATTTNAPADNFLQITRFNEFSEGDIIRFITNGADVDQNNVGANGFAAPFNTGSTNYNSETNDTREFRITRVGDTFTFYDKTNDPDAWVAEATNNRPDLHGIPMQVGIDDSSFTATAFTTFYQNFSLSGPNVGLPVTPPADPTGLTAVNLNASQTQFSWTPAAGSAGSILVIRKDNPLVAEEIPINGYSYNGNTNFTAGDTLGGTIYVVYAGPATSAVVTGLGNLFDTDYAAVYSYSGSGSSTVYDLNPATTSIVGPAQVSGITVSVNQTDIPVNGASLATVVAIYTDGSQMVNPAGAAVASTNSAVAIVSGAVVSGVGVGVTAIVATYGAFSATNLLTVHAPAYTDNFSVSQDYLNGGLPGSTWDGIYDRPGDVPGADQPFPEFTTVADANVSSNDTLTVTAGGTEWEGAPDNGFYLFKNMPGDFQAVVHVNLSAHGAYQFAGLMARAANADGSPYQGAEHNMAWWFFDQYGTPVSLRSTIAGVANEQNLGGTTPNNTTWLLLQRQDGTNFYGYYKLNATDPWIFGAVATDPSLSNGVPVQIGLAQSTYTADPAETVLFDSFMLDGVGLVSSPPTTPPAAPTNFVMTLNPDITMTLSWTVPGTNSDGSAYRSLVVMRAGAPVSAQPYLAFALGGDVENPVNAFGVADDDLGSGNYVVYRTLFGATNLQQQVTVTGLNPGVTYYAAVYTFVGLGGARTFNTSSEATAMNPASSNLVDGVLVGIQASLAEENGIPLGGVGIPVVNGIFTGGGKADITPSVTVTTDDTSIITVTNGILTGVALGSATAQVSFGGFTNVLSVSVHNPMYTDNFAVSNDYVANGVAGTIWDGIYLGNNSFPGEAGGNDGSVSACDANITTNDALTVTHTMTYWAGAADDGFLLFKNVSGDFQAQVHMTSLQTLNYQFAGLMARGYSTNGEALVVGTNAPQENWIYWGEFEEFNDSTEARRALNGVDLENPNFDGATNNFWILFSRQNGTNFTFYRKVNASDPWEPQSSQSFTQPTLQSGVPVQVGLFAATYSSAIATAQFDSFQLDVAPPQLNISASAGNAVITWMDDGFTLQTTGSLNPPNWQPVGQSPVNVNGQYQVTMPLPLGTANAFFRLQH